MVAAPGDGGNGDHQDRLCPAKYQHQWLFERRYKPQLLVLLLIGIGTAAF